MDGDRQGFSDLAHTAAPGENERQIVAAPVGCAGEVAEARMPPVLSPVAFDAVDVTWVREVDAAGAGEPAQLIESDAIPRRLAAEGLDRELCGSGGCGDLRRRHGLSVGTRQEADHRRWITAAQVIEMAHTLFRGYYALKECQPAMREMRGFEGATVPQRWKAWQVSLTSLVN